jgi:hypothetical protein
MRYAKAVWLLVVCAVLVYVVLPPLANSGDERGIFFGYIMMLFTFPLGAALYILTDGISRALAIPGPAVWSRSLLAAMWIPLVMVGYFQWFVALPWLWRKLAK